MMATNDSEPTVFLQKFIVADVTTGAILGSDFLSKNNMVVSFADRALRYKYNLFPFSCVSDRFRVVLSHDVCFSKNQKEIIACGRVVSSDSVSADNYVFSPSSELVRDVGILPAYSIVHITESMLPVQLLQAQPSARLKKRTNNWICGGDRCNSACGNPPYSKSINCPYVYAGISWEWTCH